MHPCSACLVTALLTAGQSTPEFHQDFRGGRDVLPQLRLFGPKAADVVKAEDRGLRVTPPLDGKQTFGWGVAADFSLVGDFEITGSYELLVLKKPTKGGGCGVALNIATDAGRNKAAKIGRFWLVRNGNAYVAESWSKKNSPADFNWQWVPAGAASGKLRLLRKGAILHSLVAEGTHNAFREIDRVDFGSDDVNIVRFIVNNNSSPTPLDVRLLDLTVRPLTASAAPVAAAPPAPEASPPPAAQDWSSILLGVAVGLALLFGLGIWLIMRRRRSPEIAERSADVGDLLFACSGCGKKLRANANLSGKKVKCSGCGQAVPVP